MTSAQHESLFIFLVGWGREKPDSQVQYLMPVLSIRELRKEDCFGSGLHREFQASLGYNVRLALTYKSKMKRNGQTKNRSWGAGHGIPSLQCVCLVVDVGESKV